MTKTKTKILQNAGTEGKLSSLASSFLLFLAALFLLSGPFLALLAATAVATATSISQLLSRLAKRRFGKKVANRGVLFVVTDSIIACVCERH